MIRANMQLTDYDADGSPSEEDLRVVAAPLSSLLTSELDGAAEALGFTGDEILLAALGRAIERTIGTGTVTVDVPGYAVPGYAVPGYAVPGYAVPGYAASGYPVRLQCAAPGQLDADAMLEDVHRARESSTVRHLVRGFEASGVADPNSRPVSELRFASGECAARRAHLGHVLELHAYRTGDVLALDWRFDIRSFEPYTVQELSEQFPLALIELTSEATPPVHATQELVLAH